MENGLALKSSLQICFQQNCFTLFFSGADGGLDFGVLKVLDETKLTCSLKNKGKFEINFNFVFEPTDGSPADVAQLFTVIPNKGPLLPTDRPTQVQVIFRSKSEITIKDQPVLKCQVNSVFACCFKRYCRYVMTWTFLFLRVYRITPAFLRVI